MYALWTYFCIVVRVGDVNQVISLIKGGANVNEQEDEDAFAPLHLSAGAGKL